MADPVVAAPPAPAPVVAPAPAPVVVEVQPAPGEPAAPEPSKGYWPDDWLTKVSKGDEKRAKNFGKFQSPEAMADAYDNLQKRFSSGDVRTALPKDAKPEELAQWRKDNGIPEAPDKYDLKGVELDDASKPRMEEFLKAAHTANMTPEQAKAAIAWQQADTAARLDARSQQDETERVAALDSLNAEWGAGFRRNVQMVEGFLENFPSAVRDLLKGGRLADGTGIFNNPDVMRGFVAAALQVNPAATLVPSGGGDPMKGLDDAIAAHEKFLKEHRTEYFKDEKRQADYRSLLTAREKLKDRKAA